MDAEAFEASGERIQGFSVTFAKRDWLSPRNGCVSRSPRERLIACLSQNPPQREEKTRLAVSRKWLDFILKSLGKAHQ